ncbi:MAG: hypothetical protein HY941_13065 [Gammaproteobacteria bacterium]|nr:hypothetical protein [Gammaproteobacteria bacterium]
MATEYEPRIGDWYRTVTGDNFEIVALDADDETLEIQYFDGTVEELDMDTWYELNIEPIEPPEDWSGSMDIARDDYGVDLETRSGDVWANPLDNLDRED